MFLESRETLDRVSPDDDVEIFNKIIAESPGAEAQIQCFMGEAIAENRRRFNCVPPDPALQVSDSSFQTYFIISRKFCPIPSTVYCLIVCIGVYISYLCYY